MAESFSFMQFRRIHEFEDNDRQETNKQVAWLEKINSAIGKIVLLGLIALLIDRTYGTIEHYLDYPTYFETRYVSQFHAQMPALTICPLVGYKVSVLKVKY